MFTVRRPMRWKTGFVGIEDDLCLALRAADLADGVSMGVFTGAPLRYDTKVDGTPVTAADAAVEAIIRETLITERPGDVVLGEETGGWWAGTRRWIVDGIDGTANFAAGSTAWGTLIALEEDGAIAIGVASNPAKGARWWAARTLGAWTEMDGAPPRQLQVSTTEQLTDARVVVHPPARGSGWASSVAAMVGARATVIDLSDHPGLMVACGDADAAVLVGGAPWDHAALTVIVEEAGGRFTDHLGGRRIDIGGAILSNLCLHDELLTISKNAQAE
jgi:histidinol-phosphatase